MRIILFNALILAAVPLAVQADDFRITPGKYSSTTTMKMPMMPNGMQRTVESCLTEKEANLSPAELAQEMSGSQNCSVDKLKQSSTTMSFEFQCTEGEMGSVTGRYNMSGGGDNFTFSGEMDGSIQGQAVNVSVKGTSKRIGDC
ncbi:MAG: DUF3617 family protein [Pseudomonadota bacterium]